MDWFRPCLMVYWTGLEASLLVSAEWVKPPGKAWRSPPTLFNTTLRILLKVVKRGYFGSAPYVSISRVGEVKMPRKSSKCLLPPFFEPDFNCSSPTIGSLRSGCRPFIAREHWFFRGSGMNNWSPVQRLKEKNLTSRFPKNSGWLMFACFVGMAGFDTGAWVLFILLTLFLLRIYDYFISVAVDTVLTQIWHRDRVQDQKVSGKMRNFLAEVTSDRELPDPDGLGFNYGLFSWVWLGRNFFVA